MKEVPQVPDALDTSNPIIWYILCLIANQLGGKTHTQNLNIQIKISQSLIM